VHVPLEVAAINLDTGEELYFVPWTPPNVFDRAAPEAMKINRWFERGLYTKQKSADETYRLYADLWNMLDGNTLAGCNPRFDADMLRRGTSVCFDAVNHCDVRWNSPVHSTREPWHYRLADLSAYAAGVLGIPPHELPGLAAVCDLLGVTNDDEHSAYADAAATAACFRQLTAKITA
jgi:DNA polymerase-3 subunit epsilon